MIEDTIRQAILQRASSSELQALAWAATAYSTLREDGLLKAMAGMTTLAEVLAHTPPTARVRGPAVLRELGAATPAPVAIGRGTSGG